MQGVALYRLSALTLSLLISVALFDGTAAAAPPDVAARPHQSVVVPGRYIVVLRSDVPSAAAVARDLAARHAIGVSHVYEHALKGFAADVPAGRLLALRNDPRVAFVEPDQTAHTFAQAVPTGVARIFAPGNAGLSLDGKDDWRIDADVAVIDTGIAAHPDLNVVASADCSGGGPFKQSCTSNAGTDGNGHGTHVAGTIGAIDNGSGVVGVAPGVRLWSVKVLGDNGSGYISWIVAGVDWVTANATSIEVANMSLGCECASSALDTAIASSVGKGVVYVVAAGNSNKDASTFSPANHPDVITVSALADFDGLAGGLGLPTCRADGDDTLANFSNYGRLVEIAAPGVCILSTWHDGGYNTISGTSMAAPHVAGAAALRVATITKPTNRNGVHAVRTSLVEAGNYNWIDDSGDSVKEPLLDVSDTSLFNPRLVAGQDASGGNENLDQEPATTPAMGVFAITTSGARHIDIVVNVRADSNDSGNLTASGDAPVAGAGVTLRVIREVNGAYACTTGSCWDFAGNTDGSGTFKAKLQHAQSGSYEATVRALSATGHAWDPALDVDGQNPRYFSK